MVRLCCFTSFASKTKRYVMLDLKPSSLFCLQTHHFLSTNTTVSPKQSHSNSTVNYLINSCGLSPQGAVLASKWVKLQSQERADSVLVCLRNHGFSQTQISRVVRSFPQILSFHFEKTISPKLHYFTSFGISEQDLTKAVASTPGLLRLSLENQIIPTHNFLRTVLPQKSLAVVLSRNLRIFTANHYTIVTPNISLLYQVGMSRSYISNVIVNFTRLVVVRHEKFAKLVAEAKGMGFSMKNSTSLWAMNVLRCTNTLNRSRKVFMVTWGWSEDDFLSAFRKHPQSMLVSEKKLMQVMDFLVNKMGWPSLVVAKYPKIVTCSLENKIIPRCLVFKALLSKGLIKEDLSLLSVLTYAEDQFLDMFVTKFVNQMPQLLGMYQGNVDINDIIP